MSLQDRIRKLEGKGPGDCQLCGLAHPTIIVKGEVAPDKCPGCGGGLVIVTCPNEHARELLKRIMAGERTEGGISEG
jgi:hypothetical protein